MCLATSDEAHVATQSSKTSAWRHVQYLFPPANPHHYSHSTFHLHIGYHSSTQRLNNNDYQRYITSPKPTVTWNNLQRLHRRKLPSRQTLDLTSSTSFWKQPLTYCLLRSRTHLHSPSLPRITHNLHTSTIITTPWPHICLDLNSSTRRAATSRSTTSTTPRHSHSPR